MLPRKLLPKPSTAEAASGSSASPDQKPMVIKILPEPAKFTENRMISLEDHSYPSDDAKPPAPPAIIIKASDVSNTVVLASRKILNQCGVCDKKFNNTLELNNHMKLEHAMHRIDKRKKGFKETMDKTLVLDKKTYQYVPKTPPKVSKREREISEASASSSPSRVSKRARKVVDYKVLARGDPLELDEEEIHIKQEFLKAEDSDNYEEETQSYHAETDEEGGGDDDNDDNDDVVEDTVSKNIQNSS